ncbi:hypothetical protein TRFO_28293 [Tritrichomonas foetus]|uniref:Right handed beta helix domain-containing protein n=1 Tax=Tritrichomonas foetus TaxID=1144522 RepID=A0A1J4K428_9EUKA|nr:hypothetical protein TRFO_28293 [Tritrichomonas foetus]|eukprot:OHT04245.1 hypothetical protein TRFO_28293 [Tritrichomonas foetus]
MNISNGNCIYLSTVYKANFESCDFKDIKMEGTQSSGGGEDRQVQGSCFFIEMPKDGSQVLENNDWVVIDGCTFLNCYVKNNGGAIYVDTRTSNIQNCIFEQCSCGQNSDLCQGGAVFLHEVEFERYGYETIKNCNFTKCSASYSGGAIYADALDDSTQKIRILQCSFIECTSNVEGGAISSGYTVGNTTKDDNDLIVEKCLFTRCQSGRGGALYSQDGTEKGDEDTQIEDSTFDECYATSGQGFALYLQSYSNKVSSCTFKNHKGDSMKQSFLYIRMDEAPFSYGPNLMINYFINNGMAGIEIHSLGKPTINSWKFYNYSSNAPLLNLESWSAPDILFSYCTFQNITNSRVISINNNEKEIQATFDDCEFLDMKVDSGNFAVGSCFFLLNTIHTADIIISKCDFINTHSKLYAGAIYSMVSAVSITDCKFNGCSTDKDADCRGGAIYLIQSSNDESAILSNCVFTNCTTGFSGGGLFVQCKDEGENRNSKEKSDPIILENCNFTKCTSETEGGGVSSGSKLGEISTYGDNDMYLKKCTFTQCQSKHGGGIYFQDGTKVGDENTILEECTFDNCYATDKEGYAVSCRSYTLSITNCTFKNHLQGSSPSDSFLYINMNEDDATPIIEDCIFENNGPSDIEIHSSAPTIQFNRLTFINYYGIQPVLNFLDWEAHEIIFNSCIFHNITNNRCVTSSKFITTRFSKCNFSSISFYDTENTGSSGRYKGAVFMISFPEDADKEVDFFYIENCYFKDIYTQEEGGAIHADSNALELKLCTFDSCSVGKQGSNTVALGGAVYINQKAASWQNENIKQCTFINCSSSFCAGGLYVHCIDDDSLYRTVTVSQCVFIDCKANENGGALTSGINLSILSYGDDDITLMKCNFTHCQAKSGGALYFHDGTKEGKEDTTIMECIFEDCHATSGEGHSVSCRSYRISITMNIFKNHQKHGYTKQSILFISTNEAEIKPSISSNTFENNQANAIEIHTTCDELYVSNLIFINYVSTGSVDPVINMQYWECKSFEFSSCIFSDFTNTRVLMLLGVDVKAKFAECQFKNITTNDSASGLVYGGALYIASPADITLKGCTFDTISTVSEGGAIYAESNAIEINGCKFISCKCIDQNGVGGAVSLYQTMTAAHENIIGCVFIKCYAGYSGGGFYVNCRDETRSSSKKLHEDMTYQIYLENCIFTECTSGTEGGGVSSGRGYGSSVYGDNDMYLKKCTFTQCQSKHGGGIYFQDGTKVGDENTILEECTFDNCYATDKEGYAVSCRSYTLSITNCTFKNHLQGSSPSDSFLYINMNEDDATPIIEDCIFENNLNSNIHISSLQFVSFCRCKFINNEQQLSGSPLTIDSNWKITVINISECEFYNNKGQQGGSLSISQHGKFTLWKCIFIANSAENGGAIYALKNSDSDSLTIENCQIHAGSATGYGGAIYSTIPNTAIKSTNITQSTATQGSAIYLDLSGNSQILNVSLLLDKQKGQTAIFISGKDDSATLKITGGCFVSSRDLADDTPDFFESDSTGKIEFIGQPCFSGTKEQSIKLPSTILVDNSWFNCKTCNVDPLPSVTFTPTSATPTSVIPTSVIPTSVIPTSVTPTSVTPTSVTPTSVTPTSVTPTSVTPTSVTPTSATTASQSHTQTVTLPISDIENITYTSSSESSSNTGDSDSGSSNGKTNAGAIAGIVIAILVIISCIVIIILIIIFKRKADQINNPNAVEAVSQEADAETLNFTQNQTMQDENEVIWSGDFATQDNPMTPANDQDLVDDPFMRDIEEGF